MRLLIDGYNLLHVTSVFADRVGPHSLESLHRALASFLAVRLDSSVVRGVTIVFDAKGRNADQRREREHQGIRICYAARHETADELIAEILAVDHAPRQITVVSSDHEVQRAARRRRAKAVDSEVWLAELLRSQRVASGGGAADGGKPQAPLTSAEIDGWKKLFRIDDSEQPPDSPLFPPEYLEEVVRELERE